MTREAYVLDIVFNVATMFLSLCRDYVAIEVFVSRKRRSRQEARFCNNYDKTS